MFLNGMQHTSVPLLDAMRRKYHSYERRIREIKNQTIDLKKANLDEKDPENLAFNLHLIESLKRDISNIRYVMKTMLTSVQNSNLMKEFLDTCDDKDDQEILIQSIVDIYYEDK